MSQDADLARQRQDKDLDEIGRGVDELGDMARNMQVSGQDLSFLMMYTHLLLYIHLRFR